MTVERQSRVKLIREGHYMAEVDVECLESGDTWSHSLSVADSLKLDTVRETLREGNTDKASLLARIYEVKPTTSSVHAKSVTCIGPAGAIILLKEPSTESIILTHNDGDVTLARGAAFVIVKLRAMPISKDVLRDRVLAISAEALDYYSIQSCRALTAYRSDYELIYWIEEASGYRVTIIDTLSIPAPIINAQLSGGSAVGPPKSTGMVISAGFRYYRMSLLADDLFDAFRNAYLCLEWIVSNESPRVTKKGPNRDPSELSWLNRVLQGPLKDAIPSDFDISVDLPEIYNKGRLPLFHGKAHELIYVPQGVDREVVKDLLRKI